VSEKLALDFALFRAGDLLVLDLVLAYPVDISSSYIPFLFCLLQGGSSNSETARFDSRVMTGSSSFFLETIDRTSDMSRFPVTSRQPRGVQAIDSQKTRNPGPAPAHPKQ